MRIRHALLSAAVSVTFSLTLTPPAQAQTLFQKLFGIGGNTGVNQPLAQPRMQIPAHRFHRSGGPSNTQQSHLRHQSDMDEEIGPPDSGGPYRTLCVRACDGYYFPLRHHALRKNFAPGVKSCRSACGDEARLFYYTEDNGSPNTMVDLSGRKYSETPHAFAYRKALSEACTCKPAPWSAEEAARHMNYAFTEAAQKAKDAAQLEGKYIEAKPAAAVANTESLVSPVDVKDNKPLALAEAVAEKALEPETYEPVRPAVQKVTARRKTFRQPRERVYVTGFRPTSTPVYLPQRKIYLAR